MTGALAIYSIITICNSANLGECRSLIAFSDYRPGYTASVCRTAMALEADEWLKAHKPKWFISEVRCKLNEERGA